MAGLKFRILIDTKENNEIFRDVLVPDNAKFMDLYQICLSSFAFKGDQMASFYVSNDDWSKGEEITLEDMNFSEEDATPTMNNTLIRDYIESADQKFILVYDFMKMWIFLIELIAYEKETPSQCITTLSIGEAPSEDSRSGDEEIYFDTEEEDEFGFDELDEGFDSEDYSAFDDYDNF